MIRSMKVLAAAAMFAVVGGGAQAAPDIGKAATGVTDGLIKVHGEHRRCERGPNGWHRHNREGERRPCREWRGQGRRPDSCVKLGPVWYCEY